MAEITTNDRFDTLTNLDIATHYRNTRFYLFPHSFLAAFSYWVTAQNPNDELINLLPALKAYSVHVNKFFKHPDIPECFTYEKVSEVVNEDIFEAIPEIMALNTLKPDFIDLGALARNIFYMVLREYINQDTSIYNKRTH